MVLKSFHSLRKYPVDGTLVFFLGFVILHFLVWTLLPLLIKPNYPLDVVECFIYGQEWALSSGKHPPFPSWATEFMSQLTGKSKIAPYLCSQIIVALAFFSIWCIARKMLSRRKAVLAVCVMEFYTYFTFSSLEFNNSISLIGCWSLATLSFFYALENGKRRYWVLTGVFLGFGCLCKYSCFILILMMLALMVYEPRARKYWKTSGPYLTTLVAALIFLPHFLDVASHRFLTLQYLSDRAHAGQFSLLDSVYLPIRFLLTQLGVVFPIVVVFLVCCGGKFKPRHISENETFYARFLHMLVLWPLLFQVLISLLLGLRLSTVYGSHIWIFLGLYLAFFLDFDDKKLTLKRLTAIAGTGMVLMVSLTMVHDVASPYLRGKPSRIHFPGEEISRQTESLWHARFSGPCPHLVGEWWLTGCVAAYGNDDPVVFCYMGPEEFHGDKVISVWADPDGINKEGGICLWNESHYETGVPPELWEQYPTAEIQPTIIIPFATGADISPLKLGMAIVAPPIPDSGN